MTSEGHPPDPSRRAFLRSSAFLGGSAAALGAVPLAGHPDLGPKNNQATFARGRLRAGRSEFIKRFVSESLGSTNAHGHITVCQGSVYLNGKAMSDQFAEGKLTGGQKLHWQADTGNVAFLLARAGGRS